MNHLSFLGVTLCFASATLYASQAMDYKNLKKVAAEAIAEYRTGNDIDAISKIIPELSSLPTTGADGNASETLVTVSASLLNALYQTAEPDFDRGKKPAINSEVPGGGYRAGTDPKSISDPIVRAEYEAALAHDRSYADKYREQYQIHEVIDRFAIMLRESLKNANAADIRDLLVAKGMDSAYGSDFFQRLQDDNLKSRSGS